MINTKIDKNGLVLAVDDEPGLVEVIKMSLDAEGISCITATSVEEACSLLRQNRIALLLLDWCLDKSGIEVLRVCRSLYPRVPVVVMSAISPKLWDTKTDAFMAGADSFLEKPFSPTFGKHIKHLLDGQATGKPLLPEREQDIVSFEEFKLMYVRHVVKLLGGNAKLAADRLKMHRHTVSRVIRMGGSSDQIRASKRPGKEME
jgi:DNA-binding response OmpR family regulator